MKLYDFTQAYLEIVNASVERNTKELPAILSCLDFEGKECLEIGTGVLARLAIKLSGFAKHITCLERYEATVEAAKKAIKEKNLEKTITVELSKDKTKLPFPDKSFDVVYGAWLPTSLTSNPAYLDELARVSRNHILLIVSGPIGDIPPMVDLVKPGSEAERRLEQQRAMQEHFKRLGYEVRITEETLKLDFPTKEAIRGTFYCFDFDNALTPEQQKKVNAYLDPKTHDFKDNFYCLHAWKK